MNPRQPVTPADPTMPDITAREMQGRVKQKLQQAGFPGLLAGLFARKIPKLERWNKG